MRGAILLLGLSAMTTTAESLVERARLTDEDVEKLPCSCIYEQLDAQLSKALWAVVDWLREQAEKWEMPTSQHIHTVANYLEVELEEAAGLGRAE